MKILFGPTHYALGVCSVAAMLAGCGGSQGPTVSQGPVIISQAARGPMPQASPLFVPSSKAKPPGWLSPEAIRSAKAVYYIYVADYYNSEILIYPESGKLQSPIGMISSGVASPWGLYVSQNADQNANLFVANSGGNSVTVYPAGSTSPSATYSQDLSRPLYPIVDSSGDLFVSNANNGTVVEYPPGSTTPSRVLQTPGNEADGMDFDPQGNLYVAYRNSSSYGVGSIEEFAAGSSQGRSLGMTLNQPQGVIVDKNDNILAVETGGTNRIDVFPPGAKTPSLELPTPNGDTPTQLAIFQNERELYLSAYSGTVYKTRYPLRSRSSLLTKDDAQTLIQGVAISNGQTF